MSGREGLHTSGREREGLHRAVTWCKCIGVSCMSDLMIECGRCKRRTEDLSMAKRCIKAYIRDLRHGMEGSKGGTSGGGKSYTGKQSIRQRFETFRKMRLHSKLPLLGDEKLFGKCWREEEGIVEMRTTGHSICDECVQIGVLRDTYEHRQDSIAKAKMQDIVEREDIHKREHRGERDYADDNWNRAEVHPSKLTMMNMDAPTQNQLEIPVQPRKYRDTAKCLEGAPRWCSKMMGVMIAGLGMLCFLAHARLGSGPNLTVTCLYLSLMYAGTQQPTN